MNIIQHVDESLSFHDEFRELFHFRMLSSANHERLFGSTSGGFEELEPSFEATGSISKTARAVVRPVAFEAGRIHPVLASSTHKSAVINGKSAHKPGVEVKEPDGAGGDLLILVPDMEVCLKLTCRTAVCSFGIVSEKKENG